MRRSGSGRWLQAMGIAALCAVLTFGMERSAAAQAPDNHPHTASGNATTPEARMEEKDQQEARQTEAYKHSPMVKKVGAMVGMNPEESATVLEILNFILLAGGVTHLLIRMLPKTFRNRNWVIRKGLIEARLATKKAADRLSSVEERLAKLDGQIAAMKAQALKDAAREEKRFRAAVEEDKKKILQAAEQEIAAATMLAQKQLRKFAAELAIEQAAQKLVVTAETDRLLVQSFAQRLAGNESKKGQN